MKNLFIFLLLCISIVGLNAQTADSSDIFIPSYIAPIVSLNKFTNMEFYGNSFVVDVENKLFATSYRLLASGTSARMVISGKLYSVEAHLEWTIPFLDLAIVRLIDPDNKVEFPESILFTDTPDINTEVQVWGYKITEVTSESMALGLDFVNASVQLPYITAYNVFLSLELTQDPVFHNEYIGAPVITADGKVIGMLVNFDQNYGFAILSSDINEFVQKIKASLENE